MRQGYGTRGGRWGALRLRWRPGGRHVYRYTPRGNLGSRAAGGAPVHPSLLRTLSLFSLLWREVGRVRFSMAGGGRAAETNRPFHV